jgi:amino acid permease
MNKRIKNVKNYYPFIIIFIIIHFLYFTVKIGSNDKFKTLISFYGSLSIFISTYTLFMTINNTKLNRISSDVVYLNKVLSDMDNDIYNFIKQDSITNSIDQHIKMLGEVKDMSKLYKKEKNLKRIGFGTGILGIVLGVIVAL